MIQLKEIDSFYVITGGPGVGKTTLLKELRNREYKIVPEIARELIKEQKKINGEALPWKNKELYKKRMFNRSINSFELTENTFHKETPIFFDRGFLDSICYATLIKSEITPQMKSYAKYWRYNKSIFMLPPWQAIYENDNERKQGWREAVLTFKKMCDVYKYYGYDIVEVPKKPIKERADFIVEFIDKK